MNLQKWEKCHELLIIILGIISASLFQYATWAVSESQTDIVFDEKNIMVSSYMRILFLPFIISLLLWIFSQIIKYDVGKTILKINSWMWLLPALFNNFFSMYWIMFFPKIVIHKYRGIVAGISLAISYIFILNLMIGLYQLLLHRLLPHPLHPRLHHLPLKNM